MATFGFAYGSFGDIIETIHLGAKIVELVRSGGRPSSEWGETKNEMQSLCNALTHLTTVETTAPLPQSLSYRLGKEVAQCRSITSGFESKLTASRGFLQKVFWAVSEEKELAAFRRQLVQRRAALNGVVEEINLAVLSDVQARVDKVAEEMRIGNGHIEEGVSGVTLRLRDHEQILVTVWTEWTKKCGGEMTACRTG
ncbi:hypothetical protein DFH07DRAFT_466552 [Mycena maculata]|uniref:Fungal N-terminal domain-containing protein n=1 Tax=Mycena maculata TaxID=230809 RepID=A0AAD7KCH5_9AGAR|nr:hypothetical protein DFH07DRAFT_466552 [Mycena maculata]